MRAGTDSLKNYKSYKRLQVTPNPISIRLGPDLKAKYEALSSEVDLSVPQLVRWACAHYLNEIASGRVKILPFADGNHADDEDAKSR